MQLYHLYLTVVFHCFVINAQYVVVHTHYHISLWLLLHVGPGAVSQWVSV